MGGDCCHRQVPDTVMPQAGLSCGFGYAANAVLLELECGDEEVGLFCLLGTLQTFCLALFRTNVQPILKFPAASQSCQ